MFYPNIEPISVYILNVQRKWVGSICSYQNLVVLCEATAAHCINTLARSPTLYYYCWGNGKNANRALKKVNPPSLQIFAKREVRIWAKYGGHLQG
jgi:hypothetical protein